MESFNDQPIGMILLKKILSICLKELADVIRVTGMVIKRQLLKARWGRPYTLQTVGRRYKHFLHRMLYPAMITCLLLLLAIGSRELYTRIYSGAETNGITLTLDNGRIIPIQALPAAGAAYVYVNTDSILYAIKSTTGIDCNGTSILNVPAGQLPALTRLSDGTLVHVNVASRLRFPACFKGEQRTVELEGEAYFEVTTNAQQFFTVRTNGFEVEVTGTKFNVSNYTDNDKAQVTLLEGNILFHCKNKERNVQAGQTLILDRGNGQLSTAALDKRLTAWRNGIYFFDGELLGTICKNASRLYGTTIIIESKQLASLHFSGAINRKQPLEAFLGYIRDTGNIDYYKDAKGRIHLRYPSK